MDDLLHDAWDELEDEDAMEHDLERALGTRARASVPSEETATLTTETATTTTAPPPLSPPDIKSQMQQMIETFSSHPNMTPAMKQMLQKVTQQGVASDVVAGEDSENCEAQEDDNKEAELMVLFQSLLTPSGDANQQDTLQVNLYCDVEVLHSSVNYHIRKVIFERLCQVENIGFVDADVSDSDSDDSDQEDQRESHQQSLRTSVLDGAGTQPTSKLHLHHAVWNRDFHEIQRLALLVSAPEALDPLDNRQNTPLLLAVKLGYTEIAHYLIKQGANVNVKSDKQYHLLDEAVALGDRLLVRVIYKELHQSTWLKWVQRRPRLLEALEEIPDFYLGK
jgi:hypothetical protein